MELAYEFLAADDRKPSVIKLVKFTRKDLA
jgi:hypothetical protein